MNIIITCNETGKRRTYEICQPLSENLPWIQEKVKLFDGDWQTSNDSIQISIPSNECFRDLRLFIELTIENTWIIIDTGKIMSIFRKTLSFSKKWKDITFYSQLYGSKVYGNTLVFFKNSNASASNSASAFINRFCSLYF